jgi:hypothetical protein
VVCRRGRECQLGPGWGGRDPGGSVAASSGLLGATVVPYSVVRFSDTCSWVKALAQLPIVYGSGIREVSPQPFSWLWSCSSVSLDTCTIGFERGIPASKLADRLGTERGALRLISCSGPSCAASSGCFATVEPYSGARFSDTCSRVALAQRLLYTAPGIREVSPQPFSWLLVLLLGVTGYVYTRF